MEKIHLGQYTIAKSWDDVTLLQWQEYLRKLNDKGTDKLDVLDTLEAFSDIPRDVIDQLPTPLFEKVFKHLKWLTEEVEADPSNSVEIDGQVYQINHMEKLKVKEYLDLNTVMENDKFNYAVIFAILCRKPNEAYTQEFIADVLPERIEMFEKLPVLDGMKLIAFFLTLYLQFVAHIQNSLMIKEFKSDLIEQVKSIKSSLKPMDYIIPSRVQQIMTLRKLEKSLKNI